MPLWIGTVCVLGPNVVAARSLEREGWVMHGDLGLRESEGVFFYKKFKTAQEAVEQARLIGERLGVMGAVEAVEADKMMGAPQLPDP